MMEDRAEQLAEHKSLSVVSGFFGNAGKDIGLVPGDRGSRKPFYPPNKSNCF